MRPSAACVALVKRFEGFRARPYLCPAGKPTIGYGRTRGVKLTDPPITEAQASKLLEEELGEYADGVAKLLLVPVSQAQFDALVSFAYNVGLGNFRKSTLLRLLNRGKSCADEFLRWTRAGSRTLPGLVARRKAEQELFLA